MGVKKPTSAMTIRFNDKYTHEIARAAAEIQGQSMTSFILTAIRSHAEGVLRERQKAIHEFGSIVLSPRDYMALCDALENPPKPTEALREAIKKFEEWEIEYED
jgi:uncharacterized protein (DUF1778 family)